ncbi:hypothetical protein TNCV_695951 [Trichonephila clavipes]|nr:hypothetical protein TNCV_695951 [Trichonephila clavipes]
MTVSEGRFDLSTFRSERTNEASTLTITPKRSSSRDVGTSSYRYHTVTYPPASVSSNRRTNDTIFVASIVSDSWCPWDFYINVIKTLYFEVSSTSLPRRKGVFLPHLTLQGFFRG